MSKGGINDLKRIFHRKTRADQKAKGLLDKIEKCVTWKKRRLCKKFQY